MDLANWNFVNAALAAGIAGSANVALKSSPKALENGLRVLRRDISHSELIADGVVVASASLGIALLPIAGFLWALNGFASMGVGICAESAPLFFGITLAILLAQLGGLMFLASVNLHAAGYDVSRIQGILSEIFSRVKDVVSDLSINGMTYFTKLIESIVPMVKATCEFAANKARQLWETRPSVLTTNYWAGAEGQYLLR